MHWTQTPKGRRIMAAAGRRRAQLAGQRLTASAAIRLSHPRRRRHWTQTPKGRRHLAELTRQRWRQGVYAGKVAASRRRPRSRQAAQVGSFNQGLHDLHLMQEIVERFADLSAGAQVYMREQLAG